MSTKINIWWVQLFDSRWMIVFSIFSPLVQKGIVRHYFIALYIYIYIPSSSCVRVRLDVFDVLYVRKTPQTIDPSPQNRICQTPKPSHYIDIPLDISRLYQNIYIVFHLTENKKLFYTECLEFESSVWCSKECALFGQCSNWYPFKKSLNMVLIED